MRSDIDFPTRINISYVLDEVPTNYARDLNKEIYDRGGEFLFYPLEAPIPHITMLMGDVANQQALVAVIGLVEKIAVDFHPINYSFSLPYFRDPARRYIFVDTNPQEEFYQQRLRLQKELRKLITIDHYGGAENVSHVTLGFIPRGGTKALIDSISQPAQTISGKARVLQVALTGARGTCIEALQTIAIATG